MNTCIHVRPRENNRCVDLIADGIRVEFSGELRIGTERVAKEQKSRERLRQGELGLDIYGWRAKLAELGVRYVDGADADEN